MATLQYLIQISEKQAKNYTLHEYHIIHVFHKAYLCCCWMFLLLCTHLCIITIYSTVWLTDTFYCNKYKTFKQMWRETDEMFNTKCAIPLHNGFELTDVWGFIRIGWNNDKACDWIVDIDGILLIGRDYKFAIDRLSRIKIFDFRFIFIGHLRSMIFSVIARFCGKSSYKIVVIYFSFIVWTCRHCCFSELCKNVMLVGV